MSSSEAETVVVTFISSRWQFSKKAEKTKNSKSKLQRQKWTPLAQAGSVNSCHVPCPNSSQQRHTHGWTLTCRRVPILSPSVFCCVTSNTAPRTTRTTLWSAFWIKLLHPSTWTDMSKVCICPLCVWTLLSQGENGTIVTNGKSKQTKMTQCSWEWTAHWCPVYVTMSLFHCMVGAQLEPTVLAFLVFPSGKLSN